MALFITATNCSEDFLQSWSFTRHDFALISNIFLRFNFPVNFRKIRNMFFIFLETCMLINSNFFSTFCFPNLPMLYQIYAFFKWLKNCSPKDVAEIRIWLPIHQIKHNHNMESNGVVQN